MRAGFESGPDKMGKPAVDLMHEARGGTSRHEARTSRKKPYEARGDTEP